MTDHPPTAVSSARIGGRYVLLEEVGRGGMATVHRAHDEVLDRTVAVKLLHDHLAADPTFLERFRREAKAAAALTHPNVVAVYDWGEQAAGAYLVLQLVEGVTLRDLLRHDHVLDAATTAGVLVPAARGLGAAHRTGFVHRDVKPENLLLGRDGAVRITDFGLARAVASTSTTFGTDVLVGSPHYLSPEAVRGEQLDPRSDVYALGVILFECLTGRPPHSGDSPYSTAMAHTAQAVPRPSSFVTDLDPALDEVVGWATAMSPDHRYVDALDFARALTNAVPDALDGDAIADVVGVVAGPSASGSAVRPPTTVLDAGQDDTGVHDADDTSALPRRGRRGWWITLLVTALVAASAAGGYLLFEHVFAPTTEVPAVVGATEAEAVERLRSAGFEVNVAEDAVHDLEVPAGAVLAQDPTGSAREGTVVELVLSAGPRQIEIDEMFGQTIDAATEHLTTAGLAVADDPAAEHHDVAPPDVVIGTDPPAGTVVDEASTVVLVVSRGPAPVVTPELSGLDVSAAEESARESGLDLVVIERREDSAPEGVVIGQDPAPGDEVPPGTPVEVTVSEGPPEVEVPGVRGQQLTTAVAELESLGLVVEVERRGGIGAFLNPGRVFDQDPGPGSRRAVGDTVVLYAYEG